YHSASLFEQRNRMHNRRSILAALTTPAILLSVACFAQAPAMTMQQRFEQKVLEYEAADRASPPSRGAILFAGDSQFYRWKTIHEDLPGYTLINRGVDSFQFRDLIHYVDRIVIPYAPRLIVLHVGGNDVHNGRTPVQVLEDFRGFVKRVRVKLPQVPIVYSSITPGP